MIADLSLLGTSLHLFLVIQDKALRFRLSCLFSTCVLTSTVSFVNSTFIINSGGMKLIVIAIVEVRKFAISSFPKKSLTIGWHLLVQRISSCRQHPSSLQCVYIRSTHFSESKQRCGLFYSSFRAACRYTSIRNTITIYDRHNNQNITRCHDSRTTSRSRVKS